MTLVADRHSTQSHPMQRFSRATPQAALAPYTWFGVGGPADWLIEPRDERELAAVMHECRDLGLPVRFLGKGANLLVDDGGVDGVVVRLDAPAFGNVQTHGDLITVGGGVSLMPLVKRLAREGLGGLEVLAGIPATLGGAIRMNCGGKHGEIGPRVRSLRVVTPDGEVADRTDVRFSYRSTTLGQDRVLGAVLELLPDDPVRTFGAYESIWRDKMASQPTLAEHSAGCIFKNPPGMAAGKLIDECGLKGTSVGAAEVSCRHANFIVARDGATARDVLGLIDVVQQRVHAVRGIRLETEVEIWRRDTQNGE